MDVVCCAWSYFCIFAASALYMLEYKRVRLLEREVLYEELHPLRRLRSLSPCFA